MTTTTTPVLFLLNGIPAAVAGYIERSLVAAGVPVDVLPPIDGNVSVMVPLSQREHLDRLTDYLPSVPPGCTLLGQANGIWYVATPKGDVWKRAEENWWFFARAAEWPATATAWAVLGQQLQG